jgi:hypothetical protein
VIRVAGYTSNNDDDPIVWEVYGQRLEEGELRFRHVVMRASDRTRLVNAFGEPWLECEQARQLLKIRAWEQHCSGGVN